MKGSLRRDVPFLWGGEAQTELPGSRFKVRWYFNCSPANAWELSAL